jgi:hypothetical protein
MILSPRQLEARSAALLALPAHLAQAAVFSEAHYPTFASISFLNPLLAALGLDAAALTSDISGATLIEASDGNWQHAMALLDAAVPGDLAARAAAFDQHVAPSSECVSTRAKAMAGWRTVVTWAVSHSALAYILPMSAVHFKALAWDLLAMGCSLAIVKGTVDAVLARHRRFNLPPPTSGARAYSRLMASLARFQGQQRPLKLPISAALVARCLRHLRGQPLGVQRNCLAAAVATVACLRPSEGARLQVCDFLVGFDTRFSPAYAATAALNIMSRKNDQLRKGHHPRIGRSADRDLDIVRLLLAFLEAAGLARDPACAKPARPHARCPVCFPLFPLLRRVAGGLHAPARSAPSPSAFSGMVLDGLAAAGADRREYSGVSARRGGITAATEAGVPEVVLWLQSGHAPGKSSRHYVNLTDPALLFQTWAAFRL